MNWYLGKMLLKGKVKKSSFTEYRKSKKLDFMIFKGVAPNEKRM